MEDKYLCNCIKTRLIVSIIVMFLFIIVSTVLTLPFALKFGNKGLVVFFVAEVFLINFIDSILFPRSFYLIEEDKENSYGSSN